MKLIISGLLLFVSFSGCTILSTGIGAQFPRQSGQIQGNHFSEVEEGTNVNIVFNDSTEERGVYHGKKFESLNDYNKRYASWREQLKTPKPPPQINDHISIVIAESTQTGRFGGVDDGTLYVQLDQGGLKDVPIDVITTLLTGQEQAFNSLELDHLFKEKTPPYRTRFALLDRKGDLIRYIDPEDVQRIHLYEKTHAGKALVLGLVLDGAVIAYSFQRALDRSLSNIRFQTPP